MLLPPQVAADFWRSRVFVKTYRERRTWWALYRNYWRVFLFHLVLFHLLLVRAYMLLPACHGFHWGGEV